MLWHSKNLGNPGGRGSYVLEIQMGEGGGSKNVAIHGGCVDFFWNSAFIEVCTLNISVS